MNPRDDDDVANPRDDDVAALVQFSRAADALYMSMVSLPAKLTALTEHASEVRPLRNLVAITTELQQQLLSNDDNLSVVMRDPNNPTLKAFNTLFEQLNEIIKVQMSELTTQQPSPDKQAWVSNLVKLLAVLKDISNRLVEVKNLQTVNLKDPQSIVNANKTINKPLEKLDSTIDIINRTAMPLASAEDKQLLANVKGVKRSEKGADAQKREQREDKMASIQSLTQSLDEIRLNEDRLHSFIDRDMTEPADSDYSISTFMEIVDDDKKRIGELNKKIDAALEQYDEIENNLDSYLREVQKPTIADEIKNERKQEVAQLRDANKANLEAVRQIANAHKKLTDDFAEKTRPWNLEKIRLEKCDRGISRDAQAGIIALKTAIKEFDKNSPDKGEKKHKAIIDMIEKLNDRLPFLKQQSKEVGENIKTYADRMKGVKGADRKITAEAAKTLQSGHKRSVDMLEGIAKELTQMPAAYAKAQQRASLGVSIAHHGVFRAKPGDEPSSEARSEITPSSSPENPSPLSKGRKPS